MLRKTNIQTVLNTFICSIPEAGRANSNCHLMSFFKSKDGDQWRSLNNYQATVLRYLSELCHRSLFSTVSNYVKV